MLPPFFFLPTGPSPGGVTPARISETFRPACQVLPLVQNWKRSSPIWIKWLNFMCFCLNDLNVHIFIYCRARSLYSSPKERGMFFSSKLLDKQLTGGCFPRLSIPMGALLAWQDCKSPLCSHLGKHTQARHNKRDLRLSLFYAVTPTHSHTELRIGSYSIIPSWILSSCRGTTAEKITIKLISLSLSLTLSLSQMSSRIATNVVRKDPR